MVVSPQSRVTSARSWYLTSFVYPLFLLSTPRPLRHNSRKHIQNFFSIENTACFPFAPLAPSGANFVDLLRRRSASFINDLFLIRTHTLYHTYYLRSHKNSLLQNSHSRSLFRSSHMLSLCKSPKLNVSLDCTSFLSFPPLHLYYSIFFCALQLTFCKKITIFFVQNEEIWSFGYFLLYKAHFLWYNRYVIVL